MNPNESPQRTNRARTSTRRWVRALAPAAVAALGLAMTLAAAPGAVAHAAPTLPTYTCHRTPLPGADDCPWSTTTTPFPGDTVRFENDGGPAHLVLVRDATGTTVFGPQCVAAFAFSVGTWTIGSSPLYTIAWHLNCGSVLGQPTGAPVKLVPVTPATQLCQNVADCLPPFPPNSVCTSAVLFGWDVCAGQVPFTPDDCVGGGVGNNGFFAYAIVCQTGSDVYACAGTKTGGWKGGGAYDQFCGGQDPEGPGCGVWHETGTYHAPEPQLGGGPTKTISTKNWVVGGPQTPC